jgi:hypothetical protein
VHSLAKLAVLFLGLLLCVAWVSLPPAAGGASFFLGLVLRHDRFLGFTDRLLGYLLVSVDPLFFLLYSRPFVCFCGLFHVVVGDARGSPDAGESDDEGIAGVGGL